MTRGKLGSGSGDVETARAPARPPSPIGKTRSGSAPAHRRRTSTRLAPHGRLRERRVAMRLQFVGNALRAQNHE